MTMRNRNAGVFKVGDLVRYKSPNQSETLHTVTKVTPPSSHCTHNLCDAIELFPPVNNEWVGTSNWTWSDWLDPA